MMIRRSPVSPDCVKALVRRGGKLNCVPKMSLLCLTISLTHELILIIFGPNFTEKLGSQKVLYFPPHLTILLRYYLAK